MLNISPTTLSCRNTRSQQGSNVCANILWMQGTHLYWRIMINHQLCKFMYEKIQVYMHKEVYAIAQGTRCPNLHLQLASSQLLYKPPFFRLGGSLYLTIHIGEVHFTIWRLREAILYLRAFILRRQKIRCWCNL